MSEKAPTESDLLNIVRSQGLYTRVPERLGTLHPALAENQRADAFGMEDRLLAIRFVLERHRPLERAVDLGGHSGFFSLSLVDLGLLRRSTVYDLDKGALAAGRGMAALMGMSGAIDYVEQAIDLNFIRDLPQLDLVICLNLLHHAGARFDIDDVTRRGWERYAEDCLTELRQKCRVVLLGLGFKSQRPLHWPVAGAERPQRFHDVAQRAGWSVAYDANVEDIHRLGVVRADGLRRRQTSKNDSIVRVLLPRVLRKLRGISSDHSQRSKYHLFILE